MNSFPVFSHTLLWSTGWDVLFGVSHEWVSSGGCGNSAIRSFVATPAEVKAEERTLWRTLPSATNPS